MAQKIVIPKGTINPAETTVIEIPEAAQGSSVVIATPNRNQADESSFNVGGALDPRQYGLTDIQEKAKRRFPNLVTSPEFACFKNQEDRTPPRFDGAYDSQLMGNASWGSTPRNIQRLPTKTPHARLPMLPYPSDFSPEYRSSPVNRDVWTAKDYKFDPHRFVAPINAAYPELPHYDPAFMGTPRKLEFDFPAEEGGEHPLLQGASQIPEGSFSTEAHEKMKALDQTEYVEQWQILADLRMYQHTRRKLIYDICNMGTGSVTSKSKMNRIMAPVKSMFGKKGKYWVNPYA